MSVLDYADGARFIIRTIKYHVNNPSDKWANSYEVQAIATGGISNLQDLQESIVSFEMALHRNIVQFDRAIISTWSADSVPYDPEAFAVTPLNVTGAIGEVGDSLALDKVLSVARVAASGRSGHLFYRGVLSEADVSSPAGRTILTDRPGIQAQVDAAVTTSGLADHLGPTSESGLRLHMIDKTGTISRVVIDLQVKGVTTLPTDHAWFNRTSSGGPE